MENDRPADAEMPSIARSGAGSDSTEDPHAEESLLDRLDRQQNVVLEELDALADRIERLVARQQQERAA